MFNSYQYLWNKMSDTSQAFENFWGLYIIYMVCILLGIFINSFKGFQFN